MFKFKYFVGMQIERMNNIIYIHQENYINQIIDKFCMSDGNPVNAPADVKVNIDIKLRNN